MVEAKRDNSKTKFIQWAMQRAMETLSGFADNLAIASTQRGPGQSKEWHFESSQNEPDEESIKHC